MNARQAIREAARRTSHPDAARMIINIEAAKVFDRLPDAVQVARYRNQAWVDVYTCSGNSIGPAVLDRCEEGLKSYGVRTDHRLNACFTTLMARISDIAAADAMWPAEKTEAPCSP